MGFDLEEVFLVLGVKWEILIVDVCINFGEGFNVFEGFRI